MLTTLVRSMFWGVLNTKSARVSSEGLCLYFSDTCYGGFEKSYVGGVMYNGERGTKGD